MIPVEERTAANYPFRDRKGLKPFPLKVWLAGGPFPKERKPMERGEGPKAKPYVKPAGQAAYEKTVRSCEVFDLLQELGLPEWRKFYADNEAACWLWGNRTGAGEDARVAFDERPPLEVHHVYRRQFGHDRWNLIRCFVGCHLFFHGHPKIARLVAALAKERKGELELEAAKKRLGGKNPVGLIANDVDGGVFSGRARGEAIALCRKYGTKT